MYTTHMDELILFLIFRGQNAFYVLFNNMIEIFAYVVDIHVYYVDILCVPVVFFPDSIYMQVPGDGTRAVWDHFLRWKIDFEACVKSTIILVIQHNITCKDWFALVRKKRVF